MMNSARTILVVSNDAALCAAARRTMETKQSSLRVAAVSTLDAARRIVVDAAPAVILLEDTAVQAAERKQAGTAGPSGVAEQIGRTEQPSELQPAVSALAAHAPVVVIGDPSQGSSLAALVSAGVVDFVARTPGLLVAALGFLEQRLRKGEQPVAVPRPSPLTIDPMAKRLASSCVMNSITRGRASWATRSCCSPKCAGKTTGNSPTAASNGWKPSLRLRCG